jgi:hypothetical protein
MLTQECREFSTVSVCITFIVVAAQMNLPNLSLVRGEDRETDFMLQITRSLAGYGKVAFRACEVSI